MIELNGWIFIFIDCMSLLYELSDCLISFDCYDRLYVIIDCM